MIEGDTHAVTKRLSLAKVSVVLILLLCVAGLIFSNLEILSSFTKGSSKRNPTIIPPKPSIVPKIPINPDLLIHRQRGQIEDAHINGSFTQEIQRIPQALHSIGCPVEPEFALFHDLPRPEFCLIGVAKGGSTSFSNYLPTHPNVKAIDPKEPNFWTWKYMATNLYQNLFVNVNPITSIIEANSSQIIAGEYSTSYILHPLTPRRMYEQLPHLKIILFLRNPIDRAYSHYTMTARGRGYFVVSHQYVLTPVRETNAFEKVILKEMEEIDAMRYQFRYCFNSPTCIASECFPQSPVYRHNAEFSPYLIQDEIDLKDYFFTSYLFRSIYDDPVERWLMVYPKEQMLILSSEYFYDNTVEALNKITEFLGLPAHPYDAEEVLEHSWGGGPSNQYEEPHSYSPLQNTTREILRNFFQPYNERLFKLIGESFDW